MGTEIKKLCLKEEKIIRGMEYYIWRKRNIIFKEGQSKSLVEGTNHYIERPKLSCLGADFFFLFFFFLSERKLF